MSPKASAQTLAYFWEGGSTVAPGAHVYLTCPLLSRHTGKQAVSRSSQGHSVRFYNSVH